MNVFSKDRKILVSKFNSVNFWRLMALENIEMIITSDAYLSGKGPGRALTRTRQATARGKGREKTMIYKYLSHHYVLRRSVVFIVDTEFSSVIYHDKANKYVWKFFK